MDLDRFVNDRNQERYPTLAGAANTPAEEKNPLNLLAEEERRYIELRKARNRSALFAYRGQTASYIRMQKC